MATIIVERVFPQPITMEGFAGAGAVLQPCLDVRGIRWIASCIAKDGLRSVCRFDATDAELVRQANREAGLPFEKVWVATEVTPADMAK
jgi:Nickel responsive protein SCO4226-like